MSNRISSIPLDECFEPLVSAFWTDAQAHGECDESSGDWLTIHTPVDQALIGAHINGHRRLAIYPLSAPTTTQRTASWFAVDIDSGDVADLRVVSDKLGKLGLAPLSFSSKTKGWHVFVLFEEPLPAIRVHEFGVALTKALRGKLSPKYRDSLIEAFPKQNGQNGGPGNFLSMPWFGVAHGAERDLVVDQDNSPLVDQLGALSKARRHTLADVEAALSTLEENSEQNGHEVTPTSKDWVTKALQGASEGKRNNTCTRLAGHFAQKGLPLDETLILLKDWASKCAPPFDASEVETTARGIYKRDGNKKRTATLASRLIALAQEKARSFFRDELSQPFADIGKRGRAEVVRIDSGEFRGWLRKTGWGQLGQPMSDRVVRDVAATLAAKAEFDGAERSLSVRVARRDDALLYDLGGGRAVRTIAGEWSIVDVSEPTFERFSHQRPQVEPVTGGDPSRLFEFVPVTDADEQLLFLAYMVSCMDPENPHMVLAATGDQGSGKSTACKVIKRLLDPSELESLGQPRNANDLIQMMAHHWFLCLDNVSSMPAWLNDCLCRACTGDGSGKRKLYSDQDDVIFRYRRCVAVNGIVPGFWGPDLLDRSLLLRFERITSADRRTEREFWVEFEAALPEILGGLFSLTAKAMTEMPSVAQENLPRMADFALWGRAVARALGKSERDFDRAFAANIRRQNQEALDASPLAVVLLRFMEHLSRWEGQPTDLLNALTSLGASLGVRTSSQMWPSSPSWLWRRLKEVRPNLQAEGIEIHRGTGKDKDRLITVEKVSQPVVKETPTVLSEEPLLLPDDDLEFKHELDAQAEFCGYWTPGEFREHGISLGQTGPWERPQLTSSVLVASVFQPPESSPRGPQT